MLQLICLITDCVFFYVRVFAGGAAVLRLPGLRCVLHHGVGLPLFHPPGDQKQNVYGHQSEFCQNKQNSSHPAKSRNGWGVVGLIWQGLGYCRVHCSNNYGLKKKCFCGVFFSKLIVVVVLSFWLVVQSFIILVLFQQRMYFVHRNCTFDLICNFIFTSKCN